MSLRGLLMPDMVGAFNEGEKIGQERRTRKTLAEFLQPALGGDQGALSKIYSADPEAGMKAQQYGQQQQTASREQTLADLKQKAALYGSAPPEIKAGLYGEIRTLAEQAQLIPAGKAPQTLDTPEAQQTFEKFIAAIGGAGQDDPRIVAPGSALVDNSGKLIYERPFAPEKPQFQVDAEGNGFWIAPGRDPQPVSGGGVSGGARSLLESSAAAVDPQAIQQDYRSLAPQFGAQISSLSRTPQRNAQVGGVPNSQHLSGTAGDFVVPQPQKAAFMAEAKRRGYEAIDEGDHVHVELPPNRARGNGIKFPTKGNASTEDKAANWQIVQGQDGTFYRVNKLTGETASAGVQGANALRANDQHQKRAEAKAGIEGAIRSTDETLQSLSLLLSHPGRSAGTGMSAMLPAVPGTSRKDFDAQLATLKAQTFVPMVSQLKGMGALSDAEGKKLTEAVGALDPEMSESEFEASLNRIRSQLLRAQAAAYSKITDLKTNQGPRAPQRAVPNAGVDDLLSKYGVK